MSRGECIRFTAPRYNKSVPSHRKNFMKAGVMMIKRLMNKIKTTIWLYPATYSLLALALSISISVIDERYSSSMFVRLNGLFYTTASLAESVLGIIAGAFITIATFTFSTSMVVLTMYSSQFTPRVIENFLNNQTTMKSFGVFLSGFIYSITSLLMINTYEGKNHVLSASVGVLYVIIGLVYFLIFINNVAAHIQASGLILRLHQEAIMRINQYRDFIRQSTIISERALIAVIGQKSSIDIFSNSDGYIQEIDYERLQNISQDNNIIIFFKKVVGQFISSETRIITIHTDDPKELNQDAAEEIKQCIYTGNKRTEVQDFSFTIQKIVEIALKALSPGINDPNTAIHCLNIIGLLMRDLADLDKGYAILKNKDEHGYLIYERYDFEVSVFDAYNQIVHYGQSDASVMIAVFKSLRFAKAKASDENNMIIDEYAARLSEKIKHNAFSNLELRKIEKEYDELLSYRKIE